MSVAHLVPDGIYWARSVRHGGGEATVVQVSTVFGKEAEYWTLAVLGSDQHYMLSDFEIIARVTAPGPHLRHAAE